MALKRDPNYEVQEFRVDGERGEKIITITTSLAEVIIMVLPVPGYVLPLCNSHTFSFLPFWPNRLNIEVLHPEI